MELNQQNTGTDVATNPPGGMQQVVDDSLDKNKALSLQIQQREAEAQALDSADDKPKPKQGTAGSLWERIKAGATAAKEFDKAGARGVLKGLDEASNTVVGAVKGTVNASTALFDGKLHEWWDAPTANEPNPLNIGDERINRWLGPAQGGVNGFIESASQFATGMAVTSGLVGGAGKAAMLAKGALTDAAFFDPHQKRLSNMVQDGPEWMRNPVTKFLASEKDDHEPLLRFKAAAEGLLLGATIESLTVGFKALRASMRGSTAEAAEILKAGPSPVPTAGEVAAVTATEDGRFAVVSVPTTGESHTFTAFRGSAKDTPFGLEHTYMTPREDVAKSFADGLGDNGAVHQIDGKFDNVLRGNLDEIQAKLGKGRLTDNAMLREAKAQGYDGILIGQGSDTNVIVGLDNAKLKLSDPLAIEKTTDSPIFETQGEAEAAAASVNFVAKNDVRVKGLVDNEALKTWRDRMAVYAKGTDTRSMEEIRDSYALNINYEQTPEELVNVVKSLVDAMPEPSTIARGKITPWSDTAKAARELGWKGMTDEEIVQQGATLWGNTGDLAKHIYAAKEVLSDLGNSVFKLSQMAEANPDNGLAVDQLSHALETMTQFHAYVAGAKSDVARALNVMKAPVGEAMDNMIEAAAQGHRAPNTGGAFAGMSRSEIASMMRMVHIAGGDPAEIIAQMRVPKTVAALAAKTSSKLTLQKIGEYALTLRIEAMLSGPKTHVTNAVSNTMAAMQRPIEYWYAGARTGDSELKQFGADLFGGLFKDFGEALSAAKKSYMDGVNILDAGNTHTGQGVLGPAQGLSFLRPSRFLMASDEFFKQVSYRSHVRAQILEHARANGITDAADLGKRIASDLPFSFTPDGGAVIPQALEYTQYTTFTNQMSEGGWGQALQERAQNSIWFRNVMPFIRTPVNIFNYAWERTPVLNRLNGEMKDALGGMKGPKARAVAQSKTELGAVLYGTASMLALSGQVTGRGPSDPDLRKQWIAAGHQPYSMKIPGTDTWMSYRRLDPTFAPLGLVADITAMSGELSDGHHDNVAASAMASITANLSSKTYMQGMVEFMDAIASGQGHLFEKFAQGYVGSFVPNALRQSDPNDTYRETYGMLDDLSSRLPGLSEHLEPRRNILGEKIMRPPGYFNRTLNPFTLAPGVQPSNIQDELLKLGKAFSMPSTTLNGGLIDLTDRATFGGDNKGQSPYDRMLELMGTGIDGSPGLRTQLTELTKSKEWGTMQSEDAYGPGGMKFKLASEIIHSMQEAAQGQVLTEYPTLMKAYQGTMEAQAAGLVSGKPGVDSVMAGYDGLFGKKKK